ncbi:MAG: hypothetical protein FWC13_00845 [Oscillospiraceae bacterium]|nr:hypothetical protein [Oscillospiraceae bacterium]
MTNNKKKIGKVLGSVFATAYFMFFFSRLFTVTASAYVDPATTAMLIQVFAGIFITLGVAFGVFRQKIIMFFKNISIKRTQRKIEKQAAKQNGEVSGS